MARTTSIKAWHIAILALALAVLYNACLAPLYRTGTVLGIFRTSESLGSTRYDRVLVINGTTHCEDIHFYPPSNELYTACEDSSLTRFAWFPPLGQFNASVVSKANGGIFVIDPKTMLSHKLALEGFHGPMITHGIDVIPDPERRPEEAVYIFVVNHLPNPQYYSASGETKESPHGTSRARSKIEIFYHEIGSASALYLRSVTHPSIITPNDVVALTPSQFLVTNDHYYRDGPMRQLEVIYPRAKWTNTLLVTVDDLETMNGPSGVATETVVRTIRNNNGLGRGRFESEVLITSAIEGSMYLFNRSSSGAGRFLEPTGVVHVNSVIDNPSFFNDTYASDDFDASGYVLAGLGRGNDLPRQVSNPSAKDPVMVWHARPIGDGWETRLIFQDNGTLIRSASAAVMIPTDPGEEGGVRRAWLFVTGFMSENIVAMKIDL